MSDWELVSRQGLVSPIEKEWTKLGRDTTNDIVILDPSISRHHVNFYIQDGNLIVEDAGSQNGFQVNGKKIQEASILQIGDRLTMGSTEYTVRKRSSGNQSQNNSHKTSFTVINPPSPLNNRIKIYGAAAVIILLIFISSKNESSQTSNPTAPQDTSLIQALNSDGYTPQGKQPTAPSEVIAEAKFREALRDYNNENYSRAILGFQSVLEWDPGHNDAIQYLSQSETSLDNQLGTIIRDANSSFANLQYRRAKAQAVRAMTILIQSITTQAFDRKIASEISSQTNKKYSDDETILLETPCELLKKNSEAKSSRFDGCVQSKKIIEEARARLGEDSVIRHGLE
jgi:pSer/pThr/pTyr-binding forkhead associated (FHA) protein